MTEQTSGFLAKKLRQNWLNRFPNKPVSLDDEQDDSLTNLNWLQNINLTRFTSAGDLLSPSPAAATNDHMSPSRATLANHTGIPLSRNSPNGSGDNIGSSSNNGGTDDFLSSGVKVTYNQSPAFAQVCHDQSGQKKQYLNLYSTGSGHARPSMLTSNSRQRLTSIHQHPRNGHVNYSPTIMSSFSQQAYPQNYHHQHQHHHQQTPIGLSHSLGFIPTTLVHIDGRGSGSTVTEPVLSVYHGDSRLNCTVDQSVHPIPSCVYPKLITRSGNNTLLTLPTSGIVTAAATDTVDTSSSGLFTTIDHLEEAMRQQYQTISHLVPCFSRQQLIYMCMQDLRRNKVTVDDINVWLMENFAYYRTLQMNWQDGFRETMIVSRCFQRVPRRKEEPGGKGDLWRLNPEFQSQIAKNRISSKFLNAWQTEVPYVSSPVEKTDVQYSRRITVDASTMNSRDSHPSEKQSPLSENWTTIPDVQESSAKRRCISSISDLSQISLTSNVYAGSSCSASSSSPPLSDLCTPPPQCPSDSRELSPLQNPPFVLSGRMERFKSDKTSAVQYNVSPSHVHDPFCATSEVEPEGHASSDGIILPDFVDTSDLHGQIRESDTIAELSQACGLNEIPTLDLNQIPDPLDLTIRGVSLKPPSDWWNNELSDSLSLLFSNSSPPPSSLNHCHGLDTDLHETFHLGNAQSDDKDQSYLIAHQHLQSEDGLIPVCHGNLENNPKVEMSQRNQAGHTVNSADAQRDLNNDLSVNPSRPSMQSNPISCAFLTDNHLGLGEESNWMDEQLNLEELDSFLGLA